MNKPSLTLHRICPSPPPFRGSVERLKGSIVLPFLLCLGAAGCYENFGDPVRVTTVSGRGSYAPQSLGIDVDGDLLVAYHGTSEDFDDLGWEVSLKRSSDQGRSWSEAMEAYHVYDWHEESGDPLPYGVIVDYAVHVDSDDARFLYASVAGGWTENLFADLRPIHDLVRSSNGGATWRRALAFSSARGESIDAPMVAQSPLNSNVLVTSRSVTGAGGYGQRVEICRSTTRGASFGSPVLIRDDVPTLFRLVPLDLMYLPEGTLVFFYAMEYSGEVPSVHYWVKRSFDDGRTWSGAYRVNNTQSGIAASGGGDLEAVGQALHATWATDVNYKHSISTDGGITWGDNTLLEWAPVFEPQLKHSPQTAFTVLSYRNIAEEGREDILYRVLDGPWSAPRRINNRIGSAGAGARNGGLAIDDSGVIYAAMSDYRYASEPKSGHEVVVAASDPNYGSLTSPVSVSVDPSSIFRQVDRLETARFEFELENHGDSLMTQSAWVSYRTPRNKEGVLQTWTSLTLAAGESRRLAWEMTVPSGTPYGDYTLLVGVGPNGGEARDTDGFMTRVGSD